jgi:hypothetical protein
VNEAFHSQLTIHNSRLVFSSARDRGKKRYLVAVEKDSVAIDVLVVDGGGGHGGVGGQARHFPRQGPPELQNAGTFGQIAALLGAAGGVSKGREIKEIHAHLETRVYFRVVCILTSDRPVR